MKILGPVKQQKVEVLSADTAVLFNTPLSKVIKYLEKILKDNPDKDVYLADNTVSYDPVDIEFEYIRDETEEEYKERMEAENAFIQETKRKEKEKRDRAAKLKKVADLKKRLGLT